MQVVHQRVDDVAGARRIGRPHQSRLGFDAEAQAAHAFVHQRQVGLRRPIPDGATTAQLALRWLVDQPNVDMSGRICLDILKPGGQGKEGAWSAALNTESVLLSIQSLLGEPNK